MDKQLRKIELLLGFAEMFEDGLADMRMGALLYHARPELGRLFIDITAPDCPEDADDVLREAVVHCVASDDNMLQVVIDTLEEAREYWEGDDD